MIFSIINATIFVVITSKGMTVKTGSLLHDEKGQYMKRKIFALVMAMCIMVSTISVTAFASETSHSKGGNYYTSTGSYHNMAADGSKLIIGGSGAKVTLTMSGNPNGYYRLYVTSPLGKEYSSELAYGGGGTATIKLPAYAPAGTYLFTIRIGKGSSSGQTNYWTVKATW